MRLRRFPNGFVELADGILTIGGGETVTIAVADLRGVVARAGKPSFFSKHPPAILEVSYAAGLDVVSSKLMINPADLPAALELAAQLGVTGSGARTS
jgi:hypothetical protein